MAVEPTNTYETYTVVGMREDLSPIVYNIDPMDAPFMSSVPRGTMGQVKHEWQTDNLDTAAFNAVPEAQLSTFPAITPTVRPNNYAQISQKTLSVSGTMEAVVLAGRTSELGYQLARLAKSLKRDVEFTVCQNQAVNAGASDTARQLASYECWITGANADRNLAADIPGADATFVAGSPTTAPTDSSTGSFPLRALQEYMVQGVIQACWNLGGDVTLIIAGGYNKRRISAFAGNSTRTDVGEDEKLTASISLYRSDFGLHKIVASRFCRVRTVLIMDPKYWSINYLRPFREKPLAVIGDSEQRLMNAEYSLCAYNAKSSGVVADLTSTP